jgi:hypothetical protein
MEKRRLLRNRMGWFERMGGIERFESMGYMVVECWWVAFVVLDIEWRLGM